MLKKKNFYKKRIIKFLIVWAIISYILIKHCTRNVLAYRYNSVNKYDENKYVIEMFGFFIIMIYSLWKARKNYIRFIRYKKMKVNEGKAMVTSFDGADPLLTSRRYFVKYRYSYKYNVDNNTYIRKNCTVEEVYNNGDIIRILYDTDNPEESITEEEYNRFTKKSSIGFYFILFGVSLAGFLLYFDLG